MAMGHNDFLRQLAREVEEKALENGQSLSQMCKCGEVIKLGESRCIACGKEITNNSHD